MNIPIGYIDFHYTFSDGGLPIKHCIAVVAPKLRPWTDPIRGIAIYLANGEFDLEVA